MKNFCFITALFSFTIAIGWIVLPERNPVIAEEKVIEEENAIAADKNCQPAPDWRSFRNGKLLQGIAHSTLPEKLKLRWSYPTVDGIPGTPAISQGKVYCGALDGFVVCLDLQTGKEIWKYDSVQNPDPKLLKPGFKAAPLVTEKAVLIGDEEGMFHCIDRKTGKPLWKFETFGEIISSATQIENRVLFGSYDNSLYCLDLASGKQLWKFETEGYVNCSPAVVNGFTFVTGCDEQLRVVDIQTGKQVKKMPMESYLIASPAIMGETLYVGTYASEVVAVNWKTLKVDWKYHAKAGDFPYHSSAALTKKFVIVGGRDKLLHCIDRKTGSEIWTFATRGKVDSSPVVVNDRIYVGSDDGFIYGINLKTGKEFWKQKLGRKIPGSPAVAENSLVIGSAERGGKLFCFGK